MVGHTRRSVLGMTAATLGFGGCISSPDDCEPASFPEGTDTREGPPSPCQFGAELDAAGMDVDGTMSGGPSASVMYYRDADRHQEQLRTVAVEFVRYRRMVNSGNVLSITALESVDNRHGVAYAARSWADLRANGDLTEDAYVRKVVETYETR